MKKLIACVAICAGLFLCSGTAWAQSGSEIRFNVMEHPLTTDKNLVSVSTTVSAQQSGDGIHFTLIVKNNSGKAITIKNIADQLSVSLYNEQGLDVSIPNDALSEINRRPENRKWKFRSESVSLDKVSVNGREDKNDLKKQEYMEIPAGGNCKVSLIIRNVKQVETPKDVHDKSLKQTIRLAPGKYKLRLLLSIFSKEQSKSGGYIAGFQSPMIDINYGK